MSTSESPFDVDAALAAIEAEPELTEAEAQAAPNPEPASAYLKRTSAKLRAQQALAKSTRSQSTTSDKIRAAPPTLEELEAAAKAADPTANVDPEFRTLLLLAGEKLTPYLQAWNKAGRDAPKLDLRPMGETIEELMARDVPPTEWLVTQLITKRAVAAIAAEPKVSKTWIATDLAISVASGTRALGAFDVGTPAAVFYYFAEDQAGSVKTRVPAIESGKAITDPSWRKRLTVQCAGRPLNLSEPAQVCVLIASVWRAAQKAGCTVELVVLDPLRDIHTAKEDKADDMAPVMHMLRAVREILGAAIVFVHHSAKTSAENKDRKRGGQKMRGSTVIHASVDAGLYLDAPRGDGKAEFVNRVESEVKAARGAGRFDLTLTIEDDANGNAVKATHVVGDCAPQPGRPRTDDDEAAAAVVHALFKFGRPVIRDDLRKHLKRGVEVIQRALDVAIKDGHVRHRSKAEGSGYEITEAGRAWVRAGRADAVPETPPPAPTRTPFPPGYLASLLGKA